MTDSLNISVKGDTLTIICKLDPEQAVPSATGKTRLLASTRGAVPVQVAGIPGVKVALNVTMPNGH